MVLAMTRPTKNRNGTYLTRIGIPANLRDVIGKSELKRSLGTKNESEAKLKHPVVLAEFEAQLEQARRILASESKLTDAVIDNIIFTWRKEVSTVFSSQHDAINPYLSQYGGLIEGNSIPVQSLLEDIDQLKLTSPKLVLKYQQLDSILGDFFHNQLEKYQVVANSESVQYRKLLIQFGIAYIKMTESALKKKISDIDLVKQGAVFHDTPVISINARGETFSDLWEEYKVTISRREPDKAYKRLRDYSSAVSKLIKMYPKHDLASITKADIAAFRNILEQLPTRPKADIGKLSFADQIIKVDELSLKTTSPSSVKKQIKTISSVFNYAMQQGKILANPAIGAVSDIRQSITLDDEKGYSAAEVSSIFTSQLFQNNYNPIRANYGRAHYWLPLMLIYTGSRAEEMAQLYVDDLHLLDDIPHIHIRPARPDQTVKTDRPRKIPIHQHLIDLGFVEYVGSLESDGRLFPKLTAGNPKKYHRNVGKWFAKYVRRDLGIDRDKIKPLHGFRHAFITSCRERNVRVDIQNAITGHSQSDVASLYGRYTLSVMNEVIQGMPKCM